MVTLSTWMQINLSAHQRLPLPPPPRLQPTYAKMLNSKSLPLPLREMWRGGMTILIDIGSLGLVTLVAILNFHRFLDSMGVLQKI